MERTLAAMLSAKPIFDCEAYRQGQITEPDEMVAARVWLVKFTATTKSGYKEKFLARLEVAQAYLRAEVRAREMGYELRLASAHRSFEEQAEGYCSELERTGHVVHHAYPGESAHGNGQALDIYLFKGGKQLNAISWHETPTEDEEILRSVMAEVGFQRHQIEQWHFTLVN